MRGIRGRTRALLLLIVLAVSTTLLMWSGAPAYAADESLQGTLKYSDGSEHRPVGGASLTIAEAGGGEVGTVATAEDGSWSSAVPASGSYIVTLDVKSLPDGVVLRDGREPAATVTVLTGQPTFVIFPLELEGAASAPPAEAGDSEAGAKPAQTNRVASVFVEGIIFGIVIAMAAIGLSLVYGVTGIVNFAHGEFVSLGALLALAFNVGMFGFDLPLVAAALLSVVIVGAMGGLMDVFMFRKLASRVQEHFAILIFTIGLSFLMRHLLLFFFGAGSQPYREFALQELVQLGPIAIAPRDLVVIAIAVVVLAGLGAMLRWTRTGQAMRALADNSALAGESGIPAKRVERNVWIIGSALAALGGVLFAVSQQARWNLGFDLLMFIFAAVILGGLGTAFGTMIGGLVVGVAAQMSTLFLPTEMKSAFAMVILVAVLLLRPEGIFNRAQRVG